MVLVQKELKNAYIGEWVNVTSLTLDKSSIALITVWQTEQITATTVPAWATVNWSSSDTTVATVSSSWLVTCVSVWDCTITAESYWVTATCSVWPWWTPWVNTVAYYPLTSASTINDMSGNGQDFNNFNVSFWTQFGVDCAYVSWVPDSVHTVSKYLYGNISWLPTWNGSRTFSFWLYNDNANTSTNCDDMYIFQWVANTNRMVFITCWWIDNPWYLFISQWWWEWTFGSPIRQQWCYNVITYNGSQFEWYVNWTSRWTWSHNINTGSNKISIFGATENQYWNGFNWAMSRLILENTAWSAQDVLDYYNSTKSLYGIS